MVIVSPYAKAGYTDSHATTFAGTLAFVEKVFGLSALNSNDGTAYNYSGSFCYNPSQQGCIQAGLTRTRMVTQEPTPMTQAQRIASVLAGDDDT
jgi:hypothetical protein